MAIRQVVLIRGLGHSGSTILDLALGSHPRMLGLGEAVRILRTPQPGEERRGPARLRADLRHQRLCTCGLTASRCLVWGELLEWLPENEDRPLLDKFRYLLTRVSAYIQTQEPSVEWVVESYQDDLHIPLQDIPGLDVRIIMLVRDVRSWVHSRIRDAERKGVSHNAIHSLARWCWVNRRFERDLGRCGKPVFVLGYEELALQPERMLALLCEWLGLEFSPLMLSPSGATKSHVLAGNRMRFEPEKCRQIRYDSAWMHGEAWPASPAMLIPFVGRMNRRLVYSHRDLN